MSQHQLEKALAAFDELNACDPNQVDYQGKKIGKELLYSQQMYEQLENFCPDASEALVLAAYSQHIQRWKIPRSDYPEGRSGYKRWRSDLAKFHADTAAKVMMELGYEAPLIERVGTLLQKKGLKQDPEVQALEDVICLVFLEHYLEDFANKHEEQKLIDIIRKTWRKMSAEGQEAALKLPLNEAMLALVTKALS